jgi:hypothetical protein
LEYTYIDSAGNTGNIVTRTVKILDPDASVYPTCDTPDIVYSGFVLAACNVGAIQAGTGETSYGSWFQWGNNYGFENNATTITPDTTVVDTVTPGY